MATTDVGTGATVVFGTSGYSAEVNSLSLGGMGRESIETSHMGTVGARTYIPGDLYAAGQLTLDLNLDAAVLPPINGNPETVTVTLKPPSGDNTWTASGFVTAFEFTAPLEDKMTASMTVQYSGTMVVA